MHIFNNIEEYNNLDYRFKSSFPVTNSLINGDCLEMMKLIPNKSIDLIFSDLPYGGLTCAPWDCLIDLEEYWKQCKRILSPNGTILQFCAIPFNITLAASNLDMLKYSWVWEKTQGTGHLNAKKMPLKCHELIYVFYNNVSKQDKLIYGERVYNPQKTYGHKRKVSTAHHKRNTSTGELYGKCDNFSDYDSTERYPRDVLRFPSDKQKCNLHSTQKPLALCEYMIKTYTNENALVLDTCMGSGTIPLAAKNLNRNFIGIEKEKKYFDTSITRLI